MSEVFKEQDAGATSGDNFAIIGTDCQIVHVALPPNASMNAEPGAMAYSSEEVKPQIHFQGLCGFGQEYTGETMFKVAWQNEGTSDGFIGITPPVPGNVVALNLTDHREGFLIKKGSWLASTSQDTILTIHPIRTRSCLACCGCAGVNLIMTLVMGGQYAFVHAHGAILQKELAEGETIVVDTNSVVGMSRHIEVSVECVGSCGALCCANEGCFNTTLTGPGQVILQSFPLDKLRAMVMQSQRATIAGLCGVIVLGCVQAFAG